MRIAAVLGAAVAGGAGDLAREGAIESAVEEREEEAAGAGEAAVREVAGGAGEAIAEEREEEAYAKK